MLRYTVVGPDGIPIREKPFRSEDEAKQAIQAFAKRFAVQGYYRDANGEAIPVAEIPNRCRIASALE